MTKVNDQMKSAGTENSVDNNLRDRF